VKRVAALPALLSLLLTGCGTTVQLQSGGAIPASDGLGGPVATQGDTAAPLPSETLTPLNPGTTQPGSPTGQQPTPGQGPTSIGRAAPAVGASKTPVKLGVITQAGLDNAAKAVGLDGVTTGDTKGQVEAVLAWIKANGNLGGHPVQLYEYAVDLSDGSNTAVQNNACTAMAQDYKVRFVVTVLASLQTLATCLAKHGIGLLADNTNFGDKTMRQFAPILANPSELGAGRMMNTLVDDLVKRGWLSTTSTIGVLADDGPDGHETVNGPLTSALRRHGLKAKTTVFINPNTGDGGNSQSSSAVLKFRADGVDRIIPVAYSPLYMMIAAETQGYRPAYAMVSSQGPGALLEATAPGNQLKNSAGIGWQPFLDIGRGKKAAPVSARETLCFALMKQHGQQASSALIKGFQAQICDMLMYLKDLADLAPSIPGDILTSARIALGKRFVSPATYRVDVSTRTDGAAAYRPLAYLGDCSCFQYVGGLSPMS
jgi:hypothetical protein